MKDWEFESFLNISEGVQDNCLIEKERKKKKEMQELENKIRSQYKSKRYTSTEYEFYGSTHPEYF